MDRRSFFIRTLGGLVASGWMSIERLIADKKAPLEQQPSKQEKKIEYIPRRNPCLDVVSTQVIIHCSECKKPVPFAKWRYDRRRDVYSVTAHCHNSVALFQFEGHELFRPFGELEPRAPGEIYLRATDPVIPRKVVM